MFFHKIYKGIQYTGGPLNKLNGMAGISAPNRSVPVIRLVKAHNPRSAGELEQLIADHVGGNCACGVVSQGTVQDFGRNLYDAQKKYWGYHRFTLGECVQWEYDLFILQTLKGRTMEDKCADELQKLLGNEYAVKFANRYADEELRVDLEVCKNNNVIAGIQVKPTSYNKVRAGIRAFNESANAKYAHTVFYALYDYDSGDFTNIEAIVFRLQNG